tara:strand:- start:1646 stop:3052 length:1407 start_codon:yes stop_codon:yes gene_type:complete
MSNHQASQLKILRQKIGALSIYLHKRVLILFFLGFSSGLPYLLIFSTLSFWLRKAGIERATIGFLSWITIIYGFKWIWAPLVDRIKLPLLTRYFGRRRSWLLVAQLLLILATFNMSQSDPIDHLSYLVLCAIVIAFASATQDIVIDAFRIESAPESMQAALAATYIMGYRLAMIVSGAGSLLIASTYQTEGVYQLEAWQNTYFVMSLLMIIGLITTFFATEPEVDLSKDKQATQDRLERLSLYFPQPIARFLTWAHESFIAPFQDFFIRFGTSAFIILSLIACYRIADIVMGVMANVFYVDMGFLEHEIATISKFYGVIMTITGALIGGVVLAKFGTLRTLLLGAVLVAATNLLFIVQYYAGHNTLLLTVVISIDNLSAGLATSAFVAYLSSLTNAGYSATQYALLSSLVVLLPKFIAGFSGLFVEHFGYPIFFFGTAILGIPVAGLILVIMKQPDPKVSHEKKADIV